MATEAQHRGRTYFARLRNKRVLEFADFVIPEQNGMTLSQGLGNLRISPLRADSDLYVVEEKIFKCQPLLGVEQAISDGDETPPVEIDGDDRLAKSLLPLALDVPGFSSGSRSVEF